MNIDLQALFDTGTTSVLTLIAVIGAAVTLFFQIRRGQGELREEQVKLRQGQVDIDQKLVDLRLTQRAEHKDIWAVHHDLYKARMLATHAAQERQQGTERGEKLTKRYDDAEDAYLALLDKAVQNPEAFDPSLKDNPDFLRFLTGLIEELLPSGPVSGSLAGAREAISPERTAEISEALAAATGRRPMLIPQKKA